MYDAESKDFDAPEYDSILNKAYTAFNDHAKEEEEEQLDKLKTKLSPEENDVRLYSYLCTPSSLYYRTTTMMTISFTLFVDAFAKATGKCDNKRYRH